MLSLESTGKLIKTKYKNSTIEILKENVFDNSIESETADYVISGFGLKTFNDQQLKKLAKEIYRTLKPGGKFSLVDVSVPQNKVLKSLYMGYLNTMIPVLGKIFLGSPETYKMLGIYTEAFGNSENVYRIFDVPEFEVEYIRYFYGCATGIKGRKIK